MARFDDHKEGRRPLWEIASNGVPVLRKLPAFDISGNAYPPEYIDEGRRVASYQTRKPEGREPGEYDSEQSVMSQITTLFQTEKRVRQASLETLLSDFEWVPELPAEEAESLGFGDGTSER